MTRVLSLLLMMVALAACRSHTASTPGPRLRLAAEPPGHNPPRSLSGEVGLGTSPPASAPAGELEGTQEVRAQVWKALRGLKRKGAWLALGLRVEGERVRLLGLRVHEGSGAEAGVVREESLRGLVEWALYRYVRGQPSEVVLTLRRGESMWGEEEESTGPVPSATLPQAPYDVFLRNQREKLSARGLSEEERSEGLTALKRLEQWLLLQPDEALEKAPSPLEKYVTLLEEERQREVRWQAVQRKLVEYEEWGMKLLDTYVPPPRRLAPGYLLTESPLREQSLRTLGSATLAWAYAHTEDPDFLKRTPSEVALYLLASRSALASAVQLGRLAAVHLDYNEDFDPEVYKPEELVLELLVGLTPGAGEAVDATAAVTGRSLTGHRLTRNERLVCALGVLLPFVAGSVLIRSGDEGAEQLALLTGRSLDEMQVLSRVASHLSPGDAKEIERLMAAASRGHSFRQEELQFLQRVARGLEAPLREAAGALKAGQKVPLVGVRTLPDGSRLLPGTPAHKAQRWVDYQFRHPEKYERNVAMMMPPPGSRAQGFIPDSVKGNPTELVWGQPYHLIEAKARQKLSLSGNLEAMIDYVENYGGHLELWVRSAKHADGSTHLSGTLRQRLKDLEDVGKASVNRYP
ncbi:hypothetical protein [Archangium sp.]|uniref:hypothetical protein n=1 Tax=Archangium sp. TaxID=1872627 RepID=UPI002D2EA473|nr:hypothetical protein [Archangium sp.]HYO59473.1 hypothetical protein [Archangium sp.]